MAIVVEMPSGEKVVTGASSVTIGSDPGCHVTLPAEEELHPRHARIKMVANRWMVESEGDWLIQTGNGVPARKCWLKPGDQIRLAESGTRIVFDLVQPGTSPIAAGGSGLGNGSPISAPSPPYEAIGPAPVSGGAPPPLPPPNVPPPLPTSTVPQTVAGIPIGLMRSPPPLPIPEQGRAHEPFPKVSVAEVGGGPPPLPNSEPGALPEPLTGIVSLAASSGLSPTRHNPEEIRFYRYWTDYYRATHGLGIWSLGIILGFVSMPVLSLLKPLLGFEGIFWLWLECCGPCGYCYRRLSCSTWAGLLPSQRADRPAGRNKLVVARRPRLLDHAHSPLPVGSCRVLRTSYRHNHNAGPELSRRPGPVGGIPEGGLGTKWCRDGRRRAASNQESDRRERQKQDDRTPARSGNPSTTGPARPDKEQLQLVLRPSATLKPSSSPSSMSFSPDGKFLTLDGHTLLSHPGGKRIELGDAPMACLAFSPDGRKLATGLQAATPSLKLYSSTNDGFVLDKTIALQGQPLMFFWSPSSTFVAIVYNRQGAFALASSDKGIVGEPVFSPCNAPNSVNEMIFPDGIQLSPDGNLLAVKFSGGMTHDHLAAFSTSTMKLLAMIPFPNGQLHGFTVSSKLLVTSLGFWDTSTWQKVRNFPESPFVGFPQPGVMATSHGIGKELELWDTVSGLKTRTVAPIPARPHKLPRALQPRQEVRCCADSGRPDRTVEHVREPTCGGLGATR